MITKEQNGYYLLAVQVFRPHRASRWRCNFSERERIFLTHLNLTVVVSAASDPLFGSNATLPLLEASDTCTSLQCYDPLFFIFLLE